MGRHLPLPGRTNGASEAMPDGIQQSDGPNIVSPTGLFSPEPTATADAGLDQGPLTKR
jgi:hypothetical protein